MDSPEVRPSKNDKKDDRLIPILKFHSNEIKSMVREIGKLQREKNELTKNLSGLEEKLKTAVQNNKKRKLKVFTGYAILSISLLTTLILLLIN